MAEPTTTHLENILRFRVRKFLKKEKAGRELQGTLDYLAAHGCVAYVVGGFLRDLMVHGDAAKPRDIDVVFEGIPAEKVEYLLWRHRAERPRRNRFGGLTVNFGDCEFDMWSLRNTWAFQHCNLGRAEVSALPHTTFLNVDAIVLKVARDGAEQVYSYGFFEGLKTKTLEINLEENPFPETCVVRSLLMAARLRYEIGPKLARYIARRSKGISFSELERVQQLRYGTVEFDPMDFQNCFRWIRKSVKKGPDTAVALPLAQLKLGDAPFKTDRAQGFDAWISRVGELLFLRSEPIRRFQKLLKRKEESYFFSYDKRPGWLT